MMIYYQDYGISLIGKFWRSCSNGVYLILERSYSQQLKSNSSKDQDTSSQQSIRKKGKPSQSIIVGVIVVAIILMIALVIRAIFFPGGFFEKGPTPTVDMIWCEDYPGNYTGCIVSYDDVDNINIDDVTITITHGGQSGSQDLDVIADGLTLQVGDLTFNFVDIDPQEALGSEDIFIITGGDSGDTVRLIYKPTDGQMCLTTFY